jgi:hypothetical protein
VTRWLLSWPSSRFLIMKATAYSLLWRETIKGTLRGAL